MPIVFFGLCTVSSIGSQAIGYEFKEAEGFENGDINKHLFWASFTEANTVDPRKTGAVFLDADTPWINSVCISGLSPKNSQLTASVDFSFTESTARGRGDLMSLIVMDSMHTSLPDMRIALRRADERYLLFFKSADGAQRFSPMFSNSDLGLDESLNDISDELSLSITVLHAEEPMHWNVTSVLSNITQSIEVLTFQTPGISSSTNFFNAPNLLFGFSSSLADIKHGTSSRTIERFSMNRTHLLPFTPEEDAERSVLVGVNPESASASTNWLKRPSVMRLVASEVSFFGIPKTLTETGTEKAALTAAINTLPDLSETLQFDAYGYHGGYLPILNVLPNEPRWTLDFSFNPNISLSQLILVPAVDHRYGNISSYGFPARFRVLTVANDGSIHVAKEWMTADCPDPGRYPLLIDVPHPGDHQVRIEVYRGCEDGGREMLALDELYGVMGIADQPCLSITASSEFESPPYWSKRLLIDRKTSLGLPLDVGLDPIENLAGGDFAVTFDSQPTNDCVIELDMGENRKLGWIALFPAQASQGIMTPGFGFPENLSLEIVRETEDGKRGRSRRVPWEWKRQRPGNNMFRMSGADLRGRWLRIHLAELSLHAGKPTLALGEIQVYRQETTYPIQQIHLEGFPEGAEANVHLMMNGEAGGYPVLYLLDWLHKIEQRKLLSQSLDGLIALEQSLQFRWNRVWKTGGFGTLLFLVLAAVISAVAAIVQRRRYAKRLRLQISSDLHDDVGALLGCSMLAGNKLERRLTDNKALHEVRRIISSTTKATHALRDIVWISNDEQDTLRHLVAKLRETAEIYSEYYRVQFKDGNLSTLPNYPLSVASKRDIFLFVKEALNNIQKHAQAQKVDLTVALEGGRLRVVIKDDGVGFDPSSDRHEDSIGFGLLSMNIRAKHLGGRLTIDSAPGSGTEVVLTCPIRTARRVKLSGDHHG